MSRLPEQQNTISSRWWVRLCQWLWGRRQFVWGVLIVGIIIGIGVNWLTSPTSIFAGTPLGTGLLWVRDHLLLAVYIASSLLLLTLLVGAVSVLANTPTHQKPIQQIESSVKPTLASTPSSVGHSNEVLFDEAHGQGLWTWYGQPPTINEGYKRIKELTKQHYTVAILSENEVITTTKLSEYAAFVLPIGPGIGASDCTGHSLKKEEVDAIREYVRQGGGLLVLSYFTGDWHHAANLNDVLKDYGITFNKDVVMPKDAKVDRQHLQTNASGPDSGEMVVALPATDGRATNQIRGELLEGVKEVATLWSCSLYINPPSATAILRSKPESTLFEPLHRGQSCMTDGFRNIGNGPADLVGASKNHKVIAVGSWRMFLKEFIDDPHYNNRLFYENVLHWLTSGS